MGRLAMQPHSAESIIAVVDRLALSRARESRLDSEGVGVGVGSLDKSQGAFVVVNKTKHART